MTSDVTADEPRGSTVNALRRAAGLGLFLVFALTFAVVPGSEGWAGAASRGSVLAGEHRLLSAGGWYEAAISRPGGDPAARSLLGNVLLRRGLAKESALQLRLAVAGGASDRRTLTDLASAQQQTGDVEAADLTLRQELAARPSDVGAWTQLVEISARAGMREAEIRKALAGFAPPEATGIEGQKVAWLSAACLSGQDEGARESMLTAAAAGPDGQIAGAARDLLDATGLPDAAHRDLATANALLASNLYGPALDYLGAEEPIASVEAERQALLGYILMATGRPEDAGVALRRSQQIDPGLRIGQLMMGRYLMASGDSDGAVPLLASAAKQQPPNPAAYLELANALVEAGDYGTAEQAIKLAVQADPENGDLHLAVATFYVSRQYRVEKALPEAEEAVRLAGRNTATLGTLGWGLHLAGRSQEALQPLEEAVPMDPESPLLRYRLGSVYESLGRKSDARREYILVQELDGEGSIRKRAEAAMAGL